MAQLPDLEAFGISPTLGFLSSHSPSTHFNDPQFAKLDELISVLPNLISTRSLRRKVDSLPYLDPSGVSLSEEEYRRAYVVLGFLVHAYVWGGAGEEPVEVVPLQLAEPFLYVCHKLGMEPVLSYAGLCSWNWTPNTRESEDGNSRNDFFELHEINPLASFTGSPGESAFYHVPVLIEAEGGTLVPLLLNAIAAAQQNDARLVEEALTKSAHIIERMKQHLPKMYSKLDAGMFYHELRPFLSGGKGMEDKGLPRGFVFQKGDGTEQEVRCIGGSAAQSSLFQFLDAALGVVHVSPDDRGKTESFYQSMRAYMPGRHREFLEAVSKLPSLRSFVQRNLSDDSLRGAYDECTKQLRQWRSSHIAVVSKYIVRPAKAAALEEKLSSASGVENDGNAGPEDAVDDSLQGTGGSALIPFLKQSRDETTGI